MRKQIAAANWKMNLSFNQAEQLLNELVASMPTLKSHQEVMVAVPYIYIPLALEKLHHCSNVFVAAQNCYSKEAGAYTGEISATMLQSLGVNHIIIGHSERREYFTESDQFLAEKVNAILALQATPIFCCGEPLSIREVEGQNAFVETQLKNSLFHLPAEEIVKVVIAYEPIWAIGTGKTASSAQAEEMHAYIRTCIAQKYGASVANEISILYGGSVKASNAQEIFSKTNVDGGLVGGASLMASEFTAIINALS